MAEYFQNNMAFVIVVGSLALLALILLMVFRARISKFGHEVWTELKKASWPWDLQETGFKRYKELIDQTVVVIVSTVLLAAYVSLLDVALANVVKLLTRYQL